MKKILLLAVALVVAFVTFGQTVLLTEDFETDGEGSRYLSSTFSNCTNNDYFLRTNVNPYICSTAGFGNALTNVQGSYYWVSEDIESVDNPNGTFATLTLNPLNVSSYSNITVSVFLAEGRADGIRWETDDVVEIQTSWDGGSYVTIGRFVGDDEFGGYLREDTNLDGVADAAAPTVGLAFTNFTYSVPGGGTNLSVRMYLGGHDGSEELAFDQIVVSGDAGAPANYVPVLANIESAGLIYNEGDAPLTITNALTVSDIDNTNLDSAFVEICTGFSPAEDVLSYSALGGISGSFDSVTGKLKLTGNSSVANYQSVLRSVQYQNTNTTNPSNVTREICFSVSDGTDVSNVAMRTVSLMDVITEEVCLPFAESFEQDGEGISYVSNTFDDSPNPDFFLRTNTQPAGHAESVSGFDGSYFWASEDVISTASGDNPGIIEFAPMNIIGNSSYTFNILMGTSNSNGFRWEQTDNIILQYNIDDAGWNTFGLFQGDDPFGGDLRLDLDNDTDTVGGGGPYGTTVPNGSLSDFEFTFSGTGSEMKIRIVIEQDGGSEELVFDNIRISGDVSEALSCADTTVFLDEFGDVLISADYLTSTSTANCGVDSVLLDVYDFTCADIGDNSVTVTVYHSNSTTSTCNSTVTIVDTTAPEVVCQNISVYLDSFGVATIDSIDVDGGSSDNCSVAKFSVDSSSFDCSELGANSVILTVEDESGNTAQCTSTVTVFDTIAPVVLASNITVTLDGTGSASIIPADIDDGSTDNCGVASMSLNTISFDCSDVGANTVFLTVTDGSGNASQAMATVTVKDTLAIDCVVNQFENAGLNCEFMVPNYISQATITASCSLDTIYQVPAAGSLVGVGDTTVTITVEAGSLFTQCSFNLNVEGANPDFSADQTSVCRETEISFTDLSADAVSWVWDFGDGSSLDSTQNPTHAYSSPGTYTVSLEATSSLGCTETIIKNAFITIHPPLARFTANPTFGLTLPHTVFFTDQSTLPDTWFWDFGDGSTSTAQNPIHSYTAFGSYKVLLTVTDTIYGCSDTVSTVINVAQDTTPPDFNCPIDTFAYADVDCQAELGDYTLAANIVDDYDPSPVIEQYPAAGTMFSDSIWVTIKASDFSANIDSCSFWVIASDTINPVVSCKDTVLYLGETGQVTLNAYDIDNGSTDNCGIASMELSQSVFTGGDAGINTVGLIVTDVNGNSATCNFTVTIVDTIPPEVWCQNIGINLDADDGRTRIYTGFVLDSVYDAGGIVSYTLDTSEYDCGDIGKNLVELSVRDVSGNVGSCTAEVTVVDNNPPTVVCRDFEVTLNAAGIATISVDSIDDGSSDACGIAGMELSQSTFTGADLGENAVYLYVTDVNGNSDSCLAVVTVSDEIAPVANCNSIDVFVNDMSGYALNSVDLAMLAAGSTDNATSFDSLTIEASPSVFTCEQIGDSVTVEITVIDEAGNESSCETTVFVNYQLALEVEDIEVSLDSGQCETAVSYPGVFTSESCAVLTQLEGLGAEGMFPAGTTVETWEVVLGESIDTVSFSVVVTPVEFAPTLNTVNDTTVSEDEVLVVELTGISDGGDCLPQELVISAESLNADLIESIAVTYEQGDSTAELSITFIAEQSGEAEVVVLVEDESGAIVTDTFAVIVESVNDAPTLVAAIADRDVQAEDVLSVSISRTLGDVFDDADGDELSWIFMSEEDTVYSWMSVNELASEYVLDFSPTQADTGCYTIIVQVSDTSGLTASDSFEVCVTAIPVGVANIDQSAFNVNIYPNPSKGLVSIEMETSSVEETEVSVSNVAGAEVLRRTFIAGDHIQLDLSENVSGMYLVRITQGGKHAIKKLILDKN